MAKIAIIGKQQPLYIRKKMQEMLLDCGHEADILDMPTRNVADWIDNIKEYNAIVSAGEKMPKEVFEKCTSLKLVSRFGVGTNEIDKESASKNGVAVCNAAGSFSSCVAECALALTLNLLRDFVNAEKDFRKGDWSRFFEGRNARQLSGKTIGLIGFGDISQAFAKMLNGFNCKILAYDIKQNKKVAKKLGVVFVDMKTLQKESDVISLHLPLMPSTKYLINSDFLNEVKKGVVLINTSRGDLIDETAVANALNNDILGAYGSDVFSEEPPKSDNPLLQAKNTMLLPHSGSNGIESVEYAGYYAAQNVIDFFKGKKVKTILNKDYLENKR